MLGRENTWAPTHRPKMGVCFHFAPNSLSHSQSFGASETPLHPLALREAEGLGIHLTEEQAEA